MKTIPECIATRRPKKSTKHHKTAWTF